MKGTSTRQFSGIQLPLGTFRVVCHARSPHNLISFVKENYLQFKPHSESLTRHAFHVLLCKPILPQAQRKCAEIEDQIRVICNLYFKQVSKSGPGGHCYSTRSTMKEKQCICI